MLFLSGFDVVSEHLSYILFSSLWSPFLRLFDQRGSKRLSKVDFRAVLAKRHSRSTAGPERVSGADQSAETDSDLR